MAAGVPHSLVSKILEKRRVLFVFTLNMQHYLLYSNFIMKIITALSFEVGTEAMLNM